MVLESNALEARGFSFAYPDGDPLLGPLDWTVPAGAFQLLVGATGSGKTTLLRCCKPAIAPAGRTAGALHVFGRPVRTLTELEAATEVAYVAQNPDNQIVCDTVWHEMAFGLENLGVAPSLMRRRIAEVAHFFALEPWFHRVTDELSGGQKQLLNLASALTLRPRVLLLDEPTASLDPVAEKNFLHGLFRVNRELGITVVVATHAPEAMAAYATDAVALEGGRLQPVPLNRFASRPLPLPTPHPVADRGSEATAAPGSGAPVVEMRDGFVRYGRNEPWVLRHCDFQVEIGSIVALVGGNGCGKSTLLKAIAGVMRPERGRVLNPLAEHQALLPQNPRALFVADTVREELAEWQKTCGYDEGTLEAALAQAGLADQGQLHPYDLSGGQQQQLALAKLMLTQPRLLLLDEPTKGLDGAATAAVAQRITDFAAAGGTVILATHDLPLAALVSHRTVLLFDGMVACDEPTDEFFRGNLFYEPRENAFTHQWLQGAVDE